MTLEELEIIVKANVEEASKKLEDLKAQMENIEKDEKVQKNFDDISKKSEDFGATIKKTSKDFSVLETTGKGALDSIGNKLGITKAEMGEIASGLGEMGTALGSVLTIVGAIAIAVVAVYIRVKLLIEEYKLIWKVMTAFLTPAVKIFVGLLKQVAKVIKDQVSQAISTLNQKLNDGINNLVQVSNKLNGAMSSLKSSLTQAGNALASAVAPVIEAIIPLMNNLLAVITNVANGIAQVTASLFGNATTFKKATKVNENYAKSLTGTNKALKGVLASFDELNVISEQNSGGGINPADMFEDTAIDGQILDPTNKLKELWDTDNTEGLKNFGNELGEKLKEQIQQLPAEEWGKDIGKNVNKALTLANGFLETQPFRDLGGKIADLLLGFIDDKDGLSPETVGEFIGNLINNAVGMIKDFLDEMDAKDGWRQVGHWLAEALNNAIDTMNAGEIGEAINSFVNGVLDGAIEFFDTADWDLYFKKIKDILDKQDWADIIAKILTLLWRGWTQTESLRQTIILSIVTDVYKAIHDSSNPFVQLLLGKVFWIVDSIAGIFRTLTNTSESIVEDIKIVFKGLLTFFEGVFTGDWDKIWSGLGSITSGVFWGMYDAGVAVINSLIVTINKGIDGIERIVNSLIGELNGMPFIEKLIPKLNIPDIPQIQTRLQMTQSKFNDALNNWQKNNVGPIKTFANGGVLSKPTLALMGEYAGASNNPEIVAPQSLMLETNMRANVPVMNSIEEMGDKIVNALNSIGVFAEFDYSKLKVGLDNENYRVGGKLYGV